MIWAVALAAAATWFDLRERRIPNWLCAAGFALGVALHWRDGLLGAALAMAIYAPLYLLRGVGAGDVKLMAAVGAIAGPWNWLGVFAFSSLATLAAALWAIRTKRDKLPVAPRILAGALLWWAATAARA
ncbi:MAG: A24 family peptidase [Bryobacteraceae bacterium]|nr:A24 family peptidase [Bryobacteraceae bacterium]